MRSMPKVIVLVAGGEQSNVALADAAAAGATGVRFTEVDVRAYTSDGTPGTTRYKTLESLDRIADYDGMILVHGGAESEAGDIPALLDRIDEAAPANGFPNLVIGIVGGASVLANAARLGGIIAAEPRGLAEGAARATALGARVAKLVEWVRHALSHESHDHTEHAHTHQHPH
jgi:putative intracellular protease/amidase